MIPDHIPSPAPEHDYSWMLDALCRGASPDIFFPSRGENQALSRAKSICAACPVQEPCLDYALDFHLVHGIYGGHSERQRRNIRGARLRQARLLEIQQTGHPQP